ncbi:MAG TPA: hypothetical protein VGS58_00345 [Candidatus Sulfopaludibacter sp.]|nr:hypothetical protein [Candidatus Sulfopaludibacter sp.]
MPVFKLNLEKSYYEKGFFNVTVDFDRYVGGTGPIELILGKSGRKVMGKIDRSANRNGTPRIMGGAPLRDWFQANYALGDAVDVDLSSVTSIRMG